MGEAKQKERLLRIGELAKALGTTTKTLRHYEQKDLLRPPQRTENDHRMYDESDLRHAREIMGLRRIGLSIDEIRGLLTQEPGGSSRRQRLLGLLDQKLSEIDQTLSVMQGQRDDLAARYLALLDTPRQRAGNCVCDALLMPCSCAQTAGRSDDSNQDR